LALTFAGDGSSDGLFYYGSDGTNAGSLEERFAVYDRAGLPCGVCQTPIRRIVQAARSTYYCPQCQR
jgi:formamidopyrimidine-DNA glycosylase